MPYKDPERQRRYQREWCARRRREWVEANGPCIVCGSWDRPEVDHVDPRYKVHHALWSWSQSRRDQELAKCVVRCYECHLKKSITERAKGEQIGNSVLTASLVRRARSMYDGGGWTWPRLAEELEVKHHDTLRRACNDWWQWVR